MTTLARPTPGQIETRSAPDDTTPTVDGRRLHGVIPYGVPSRDLGGFTEVIDRGALARTDLSDLVATRDHNVSALLGRHPTTLTVEDREDGFHWSCELPSGPTGEDVRCAVERGDLRGVSWRMKVDEDRWDGDVRHVVRIGRLADVAVCAEPAYGSAAPAEYRSTPPAGPSPRRGTLRVEDRDRQTSARPVEDRVLDAMRAVPQGESRSLTHATAEPVEPAELSTLLWDRLRDEAIILRSGVPIVTTDRQSVKWPMLVEDITAEFFDELEPITPSDPVFADFEVTPKAIKALVRGSSEAFEDSDPDLLRIVQQNMQAVLSLRLDAEAIRGNSAKGFRGLLTTTGTQALAVDGPLTSWDPILKAIGLLAEAKIPGPYAVLAHPRVATALDLLKDGDANPLTRPAGLPPLLTSAQLGVTAGPDPTTSVVVFAPKQLVMVRRRDVTVEISREEEFSTDAVLVRGKVRAALGIPRPEAVIRLDGIAAPAIS